MREIHLLGAGRVARLAVESAARRHPEVRFTVFSRHPGLHAPFTQANVAMADVESATGSGSPLIVSLSEDEESILRGQAAGSARGDRMTVAAGNIGLLGQLPLDELIGCHRLVIIVTNPVELICEFLRRRTGNTTIYGFGMGSDRDRVVEALHHGFGIPRVALASVTVSGFHALRAIPSLGQLNHPWQTRIMTVNAAQVGDRLVSYRSPFSRRSCSVAAHFRRHTAGQHGHVTSHQRVLTVVDAITRSEFDGHQPPRDRAGENLGRLMSALVDGGRVHVSGPSPTTSHYFVGGQLDIATGSFTVPTLTADERRMLEADQRRFDDFAKQSLA